MATGIARACVAASLLLGATGCSLTLDLKTEQCSSKEDCDGLTKRGETYLCKSGICQRESCSTDAECREQGDQMAEFKTAICETDPITDKKACLPAECVKDKDCEGSTDVCNTVTNRCLKPTQALCPNGTDAECAPFLASLPICNQGSCAAKECDTDEQCREDGFPTASCAEPGRCVDATWGCVGQPDDREDYEGDAVYEVRVVASTNQKMPTNLVAKLCGSDLDYNCQMAPSGTDVEVDSGAGVVRVTGLQQGARIRMQFSVPTGELYTTNFYTQRVIRGKKVTELETVLLVNKAFIDGLEPATMVTADPATTGTLMGTFFDCEDKPAAGLTLSTTDTQLDSSLFYLTQNHTPSPDLTATDEYGIAGIVNLPVIQATFGTSLDSNPVHEFTVVPQEDRMTVVFFYPRDYGT